MSEGRAFAAPKRLRPRRRVPCISQNHCAAIQLSICDNLDCAEQSTQGLYALPGKHIQFRWDSQVEIPITLFLTFVVYTFAGVTPSAKGSFRLFRLAGIDL